uniref:DUF19 domain-containing protein n=1 Tax=Strigamia maritima TaxID=126957 RepID=T1IKB8_STRMM
MKTTLFLVFLTFAFSYNVEGEEECNIALELYKYANKFIKTYVPENLRKAATDCAKLLILGKENDCYLDKLNLLDTTNCRVEKRLYDHNWSMRNEFILGLLENIDGIETIIANLDEDGQELCEEMSSNEEELWKKLKITQDTMPGKALDNICKRITLLHFFLCFA